MKMFRLFAAFMLVVVCVSLSACSKDDDEKVNNPLVGTWVSEEGNDIITFNADASGVYTHIDGKDEYIDKFTYKLNNETMVLTITWTNPAEDEDPVDTDKIKLEGNKLTTGGLVYTKK